MDDQMLSDASQYGRESSSAVQITTAPQVADQASDNEACHLRLEPVDAILAITNVVRGIEASEEVEVTQRSIKLGRNIYGMISTRFVVMA